VPTLNWIGKDAVLNHHEQVPYRLLHCNGELSVGNADAGNLLIEGDNLHALKALLPYYRGQVKCIYIDPPYNTGNENWVYNDNVNSPEIRKWLGQVVGGDVEDLSRHDKWLCMMYPRLVLLRELLREDGAIFVSIGDDEVHNLRSILDEIFGIGNFLSTFVWQAKDTPGNDAKEVAITHNSILLYRKSASFSLGLLQRTEKQIANYKNPDNDPRGPWLPIPLTRGEHRDRDYYSLTNPAGEEVFPPEGNSWRRPPETIRQLEKDGRIWWGKNGKSKFPFLKKFLTEMKQGVVPITWWPYDFAGSTRNARAEMKEIFGGDRGFETPKPRLLVSRILQLATDKDSIVLDSFAGSGTTGHAVLQQNKEDGGNRRFILVEMESEICRNITAERLKRVIKGYGDKESLGGGFRFCTLGEPLFDERGKIRANVKFADLARHVFFTETGQPLPQRVNGRSSLIGKFNGTAYYLLWDADNPTVLNGATLRGLPKHDGTKIVFADGCRLSAARLKREGVVFKQIPYEIKQT
jgi:adenine-specific DNA-methyltransferase